MDLIGPDFSKAQFWTEFDAAGERLVMPLRRGWGAMGWALGGFLLFAFNHLVQLKDEMHGFDWLMVLLVGLGFLRLLAEVMTNLLAREMLRIIDIDRLQSAYKLRLGPEGYCEWLSVAS